MLGDSVCLVSLRSGEEGRLPPLEFRVRDGYSVIPHPWGLEVSQGLASTIIYPWWRILTVETREERV